MLACATVRAIIAQPSCYIFDWSRFGRASNSISTAVKIKLFRACVESTPLYNNAFNCTLTDTLSRKLDGCYTKLLRYALNHKWSDYVPNSTLYNGLEFVSIRLLEKQTTHQRVTFMGSHQISQLRMCLGCF
jgi:hypothetical protein